jgi:hypothetical protein
VTSRVRLPRCFAIGVAAMSLFAALPAVASATDYCVVPNAGCGGTNVDTFEKALELAKTNPDADRIFLGAWNYVAPTTSGFDYSKSDYPVEIIGKGAGQTTLTAPSGASNVLRLFGSADSSVHDLRIAMPDNVPYQANGLSTDGVARRVDVTDAPQQQASVRQGVHLENGGALQDSTIALSGSPGTTAVWIDAGGGAVSDSTIGANTGVVAAYGGTVQRSRFVASGAALVGGRGVTTINNSSMLVFGQPGVGLLVNPIPGSDATINADGMTIVGPGHFNTRAAMANTSFGPAQNADINLTNSIIRGAKLEVTAPGPGHGTIAVSYSDVEPGGNEINGPNASITEANVSNVGDAGFVDQQLGDYHLLPSSPLIDAGDPNTPQGRDLGGNPLVRDGNGDGTPRRDMGAFEFQSGLVAGEAPPPGSEPPGSTPVDTQAPLIGGFRATPSLFALARAATPVAAQVARGTRFRYTLSEPARVTLGIQRARPGRRSGGRCVAPSPRLRKAKRCIRYSTVGTLRRTGTKGANSIRFTGRIGKRALRAGRYRAVISATDAAGNRSPLRTAGFRIAAS